MAAATAANRNDALIAALPFAYPVIIPSRFTRAILRGPCCNAAFSQRFGRAPTIWPGRLGICKERYIELGFRKIRISKSGALRPWGQSRMSLNIRQIRYFVAAAEAGKVVGAASAVGISPSAITAAIQDLEETVGTQLVTRHRDGIKVTYDGYVFLQHCRNILSDLSAATHSVGQHRPRVEGSLSIGVTITVAGYFLAAPLVRFRRSFPGVDVTIKELDRSVIEK